MNSKDLIQVKGMIQIVWTVNLFISCSTIKYWNIIERGTEHPYIRFNSVKIKEELSIPTYLYIKPVIKI